MKYNTKRTDLKNKLEVDDSFIQSGIDSGWDCYFTSGHDRLEDLTESERAYLLKSAMSYFLAGDPVFHYRTKYYCKYSEGKTI